jgi:aminoglycoside phosphotransferase (APT) family kinase protein
VVRTWAEAEGLSLPPLLVLDPLVTLLDELGMGAGELTATSLGDGHSNATFLLSRGDERWVLRRPPRPPYPPSAHDVLREYRIIEACAAGGVRVPPPLVAVADEAYVGAPFYLMGYVPGEVTTDVLPAGLEPVAQRQAVGRELLEALASIHALDWRRRGLADLDRGGDYLRRQLRRFGGLWEGYRRRQLPAIEAAHRRLLASCPEPSPQRTLVHGDFRLGNVIISTEVPARLGAVVDWEMAAIGDPLADLGYLVAAWAEPGDATGTLLDMGSVTALPGFPGRAELIAIYEELTGRPVRALPWYEALASWKTAVLLEGSYVRWLDGVATDPFFASLETGVPELAERANAALDRLTTEGEPA